MEYVHQLCCERFTTPYMCLNYETLDLGTIWIEHVSPLISTGFFR